MSLLDRMFGGARPTRGRSRTSLAADAGAMREALDGLRRESGDTPSLRVVLRDLLEGELPAPTADVRLLRDTGADPGDFYAREIKPSWEGLNEAQRAARLDGFLEMCSMLEAAGDLGAVPPEMAAAVRTKTLVVAWAFDDEYGYLSRLARAAAVAP
jgi:hypothetical protein